MQVSTVITVIEVIFLFFFAIVAENLVIWKERQDIDMLYFNLYDKITHYRWSCSSVYIALIPLILVTACIFNISIRHENKFFQLSARGLDVFSQQLVRF